MSLNRRDLIKTTALIAPVFALRQQVRAADEISVALDWYPNANHAGLFLAAERGFFADAELEIDLYTPSDPTTVLQTVGAGRDAFGISYQTDLLLARAEGVPVVSVAAICQQPLLGVMSLQEAGITRPADLKGKTVGYPGIPSQQAFMATMMANDGASLDDIELINVEFNLVQAVISKQTDAVMGAYWTHETILAEREGYPVDLMRVDDWGVPQYYELIVTTSEERIASEPDLVARFLLAVQKGYLDAIDDPEAALDALEDAYPELEREVEAVGLELLIPVWQNGVDIVGQQDPERWQTYAAWMADAGLIPADLDIEAAFTTDLLASPQG